MATTEAGRPVSTRSVGRRLSTETKSAWKTTELIFYVLATAAILIAAWVIEGDAGAGEEPDVFTADKAWLYVTILTVGYMVSRGLAKSGSREPYDADDRG